MSLVEVTIALGIIAFCAVSMLVLLPIMMDSVRTSRESALAFRIYQAVAADLRDHPLAQPSTREYYFNQEGLQLKTGQGDYHAKADTPVRLVLPDGNSGVAVESVHAIEITINSAVRNAPLLKRTIFVAHEKS